MLKNPLAMLSKRERQIMDIVFAKGEASATEIRNALPEDLSNSGVRTILRSMLKKGILKYKEKELKFIYYPAVPRERIQLAALRHLKKTFFHDSAEGLLTALLKNSEFSARDLDRLEELIAKARKERP